MAMVKIVKLAAISALCLIPAVPGLANWQKAVYEKQDGASVGARVTFPYKDDSMFRVSTKLGFVTDIQLREGEELTYVAGGDTKSWLIDKAKVGDVQHVYIKPLEPGKHTNIIVNTDMHTYRLDVWSGVDEYDPLITFSFPNEKKKQAFGSGLARPIGKFVNRDYEIKAKDREKYEELIPKSIMDDGERTYIRVPDTNRYDMPVLYMVNPWDKKRTLINYRVINGYFVADTVMEHGILLFHQKYGIDFYNRQKMGVYGRRPMRQRLEEIMEEEYGEAPSHDELVAPSYEEYRHDMAPFIEEQPVREHKMEKQRPSRLELEYPEGKPEPRDRKPARKPVEEQVVDRQVVRQQVVQQQVIQQPAQQVVPQQQVVQQQRQAPVDGRYAGQGEIAETVARIAAGMDDKG